VLSVLVWMPIYQRLVTAQRGQPREPNLHGGRSIN
jgi:hypothetical protein